MKNKLILGFFIVLIIAGYFYNKLKYNELSKNGKITEAIVIDFRYRSSALYKIIYKYNVNGIEYINSRAVSSFKCEESYNNNEGCVGMKFKIRYSSKDPNINEIDLGKYNRYKSQQPH